MEHWYAVYTRSHCEKIVARELAARQIENYLPAFQELRQWSDRKKVVDLPVFPGYLFARFADSNHTRVEVLRAQGAVQILGAAGRIEPVPDFEIDSVRRLLDSRVHCFAHPFLQEGAWVRVRRGPLKGQEGRLISIKNQTRLLVSITMLARSVATEMDINAVEALHPGGAGPRPAQRFSIQHDQAVTAFI
jgi:transcription antitermination factor NusG